MDWLIFWGGACPVANGQPRYAPAGAFALTAPDSLMAEVDPTFEQQVFDISQRQRKPYVHHHDQADDLGRRVEIAKRAGWLFGAGHAPLLTVSRGEHQPVHLL
jgi:hypothetical protein